MYIWQIMVNWSRLTTRLWKQFAKEIQLTSDDANANWANRLFMLITQTKVSVKAFCGFSEGLPINKQSKIFYYLLSSKSSQIAEIRNNKFHCSNFANFYETTNDRNRFTSFICVRGKQRICFQDLYGFTVDQGPVNS